MSSKNKKEEKPQSRIVVLGDIDDENVNDCISQILEINELDSNVPTEKLEPIKLIINSQGGEVYRGFGLIDCIELSKIPVHITILGQAQSMALPILCVGHHRSMSKRSTLMYHEVSWEIGSDTKLSTHHKEVEEGHRLQDMYDSIILERSKIPKKKLDDIKLRKEEWYISPKEALKLGLIDEII